MPSKSKAESRSAKKPDTVEQRRQVCMSCEKEVAEADAIRNVNGTFHKDCMEDHLILARAEQQLAEARARRESK